MIAKQIKEVQANIEKACQRSGRNVSDVTLIAVSKTKPLEAVHEAMDAGMLEFGENKVQELVDKYERVKSPVHWHLIGHLQTNKVKYIVDKACLIHSVDSKKLAETIEKEAEKHGVDVDILLEVNVAEEETKFGLSVDEVLPLIEEIHTLPHVHIQGLMTIAPFVDDPEENRPVFAKLRDLSLDIKSRNIDNVNMNVLSMGMTNDYVVAVEEGATHVRVGTAIFGARDYSIE